MVGIVGEVECVVVKGWAEINPCRRLELESLEGQKDRVRGQLC